MNDRSTRARYFKLLTGLGVVLLAVSLYPVYRSYGINAAYGTGLAVILTYLNAAFGYHFIDKYFTADFHRFMKVVFGSMGVRLLALALLLVIIIGFTKIHQISFTVSLFISYILFSVIEINFLNKKASKPDS